MEILTGENQQIQKNSSKFLKEKLINSYNQKAKHVERNINVM